MKKESRNSLKQYYGKKVVIQGKYKRDKIILNRQLPYIYNRNAKRMVPEKSIIDDSFAKYEQTILEEEQNKEPIKPFQVVNIGSLIIDVKGVGEYKNIEEDHIILQCNIKKHIKYWTGIL